MFVIKRGGKMKKTTVQEKINVSMSVEYFMRHLFGESYYHYVGNHDFKEWKKDVTKVLKSIDRAVDETIESTDKMHLFEIKTMIERGLKSIEKSDSFNSLNSETIACLSNTMFLILGKRPNNMRKKSVSNKNCWKLNDYRTIHFSQNYEQKAKLLLSLPDNWKYSENFKNKKQLIDVFSEIRNYKDFVEWFKKEHTDIYLEIF
jgi:hypothetical protein